MQTAARVTKTEIKVLADFEMPMSKSACLFEHVWRSPTIFTFLSQGIL